MLAHYLQTLLFSAAQSDPRKKKTISSVSLPFGFTIRTATVLVRLVRCAVTTFFDLPFSERCTEPVTRDGLNSVIKTEGKIPRNFTGRISSRDSDRFRVTRLHPVIFENLLNRPDPTRPDPRDFQHLLTRSDSTHGIFQLPPDPIRGPVHDPWKALYDTTGID